MVTELMYTMHIYSILPLYKVNHMPRNQTDRNKYRYMIGVILTVTLLLSLYKLPTANAQQTIKIYWANSGGNIHRADLDGSNVEDLGLGRSSWNITIDAEYGKI